MDSRAFYMLYEWLNVPVGDGTYDQCLLAFKMQMVCRLPRIPQFDKLRADMKSPAQWALYKQIWTGSDHAEFWMPIQEAWELRARHADAIVGIRWKSKEPVTLSLRVMDWLSKRLVQTYEITEPFELDYPYNLFFVNAVTSIECASNEIPTGLEIKWGFTYGKGGFLWKSEVDHKRGFAPCLDGIKQQIL